MIYFDNAATTKINKKALNELYNKSLDTFGNPSARYTIGYLSRKVLNDSRKCIASIISCNAENIFFTSGGTEGNNIVIQSVIRNNYGEKKHIICSSIEHKSVLNTLKVFSKDLDVTYISPDENGIINPDEILKNIRKDTILICIQYINNELGSIQKIKEIGIIAKKYNVPILVDAVQAVGHIKIDISELNIDYLTASAHKFGGPKGIGFLYASNHNLGLCFGGGQEKGIKSGTENIPSISSMAIALREAVDNLEEKQAHIILLVEYLKKELKKIDKLHFNVNVNNYCSIISFRIDDISNETLINYLDLHDIYVSAGSACLGTDFSHSYVLKSIGLSNEQIDSSIRISLSCDNTIDECNCFIDCLNSGVKKLRGK